MIMYMDGSGDAPGAAPHCIHSYVYWFFNGAVPYLLIRNALFKTCRFSYQVFSFH